MNRRKPASASSLARCLPSYRRVWAQPLTDGIAAADGTPKSPFRVRSFDDSTGRPTIATLARSLRSIKVFNQPIDVQILHGQKPAPPRMPLLLTTSEAERLSVLMLGREVPALYQEPGSGDLFPAVLRRLHRELSAALKKTSFRFAHLQTTDRPKHYPMSILPPSTSNASMSITTAFMQDAWQD